MRGRAGGREEGREKKEKVSKDKRKESAHLSALVYKRFPPTTVEWQ
jgi:hypothetical protein